MDNLEALLRLHHLPGFGSVKIRRLIEKYGSPREAFLADFSKLENQPVWKERWKFSSWEEDLRLIEKENITLIPFYAANYPRRLLNIKDPPILLYVRGEIEAADNQSVAIIGTRCATPYGKEMAAWFSEQLAAAKITVVSGLARGIDTCAHEGALRTGRTLAVIGSGLNYLYPPENRRLSQLIAEKGALMSEFPMNTPPDKQTFPRRNRIVSGLVDSVILIEAPIDSGATMTMRLAREQKKTCWAVPGMLGVPSFEGNHRLIREGSAQLICHPKDLLTAKENLFGNQMPAPSKATLPISFEEEALLEKFSIGSLGIDELCKITKLPIAKLHALLMSLVLKNLIKEVPGARYQKR